VDAITLLKNDHKTVERLFKRFEKSEDDREKRQIVDEIIRELSVHAAIEEQVFYPAIREAVPDSEDMVLEALEEHHVAKWVLSELIDMPPTAERFEAKVTVLIEAVRHHVEEEEQELFPDVREALGRKQLGEVGAALEKAKRTAPRTPQPAQPDTPPGNITSGTAAGALRQARAGATAKKTATKRASAAKKGTTKRAAVKKAPGRKKATATRVVAAKKAPARKATTRRS
jgi:hemerythrin superfamily protein